MTYNTEGPDNDMPYMQFFYWHVCRYRYLTSSSALWCRDGLLWLPFSIRLRCDVHSSHVLVTSIQLSLWSAAWSLAGRVEEVSLGDNCLNFHHVVSPDRTTAVGLHAFLLGSAQPSTCFSRWCWLHGLVASVPNSSTACTSPWPAALTHSWLAAAGQHLVPFSAKGRTRVL